MVHPSDLKSFIEIARAKNVSRAAERLGLTQPSLSHCLSRLEHALGTPLLIRSKKGVTLTPAGERLFQSSLELMDKWESVVTSVHNVVSEVEGTVRIGAHTAVAQCVLPTLIPKFMHDFPKVRIALSHGLSRHMTEDVVSDRLDAAFVVNPSRHNDLIIRDLYKDEVKVWQHKDCLNPHVLMIEPNLIQTQTILRDLQKLKIHFTQFLETPSLEVMASLLHAGGGAAILPANVVRLFGFKDIVVVKNSPVFYDKICLIFKGEFRKSRVGEEFIRYCANIKPPVDA